MALINWDNSLSVNISDIDRQHKKLVEMINELNDAMRQGKGKEAVGTIINNLISYTRTHFTNEENYFKQHNYPDKDAHIKEHEDFINKVSDFKNQYSQGKIGLTLNVMDFLSSWLTKHIKGTDQKYSAYLNSKGVS